MNFAMFDGNLSEGSSRYGGSKVKIAIFDGNWSEGSSIEVQK